MTLVAPAKRPAHHKKYSGHHRRHTKEYRKAYWPYIPIIAIVAAGIFLNTAVLAKPKTGVLAYATDMSISGLLDGTNSQRASNGLGGLNLNSQLDNAAQAKANDMAARDYWSHNTPDGQTPWTFMSAAGYNYATAGENLAYGFNSSSDTITGWMNSPGHRANILNSSYVDVGFGIANSPNYQGTGPETVVVAMYASPAGGSTPPPASTPADSQPAAAASSSPAASSGSSEPSTPAADSSQPTDSSQSDTQPAANNQSSDSPAVTTNAPLKPVTESKSSHVSELQVLTAGKASWSVTALTILVVSGILLFFARHGIAWHKVIRKGERFFLKHPVIDIAATLIIVVGLLLLQSAGSIR